MSFESVLKSASVVEVKQRLEALELVGFETRNKYDLSLPGEGVIGFAAEQGKGLGALFARLFLGHWRTFELGFFDVVRQPVLSARHPFRWFFQRLEVRDSAGRPVGALQQRFALLSKCFDVEDANGRVILEVRSPIWKPWTFPFLREGREVGAVRKKWTGLLAEAFTDKDKFRVEFSDAALSLDERRLLLAAAVFVDLQYFERKAQ